MSENHPLDIYDMPGHLLRRMHQASVAIFENAVRGAGYDVTPVQFAALTMIAAQPGLDQTTLAQGIAYDRVTIVGVIDRLESKGFVRREIPKTDRRARHLFLEAEGVAVYQAIRPLVEDVQSHIVDGLSESENKTLHMLLKKALAKVGDISRTPASKRLAPR